MNSLTLFARRSMTTAAVSRRTAPVFAQTALRAWMSSTASKDPIEPANSDYYDDSNPSMHAQFEILEQMIEKNLHLTTSGGGTIDKDELKRLLHVAKTNYAVDAPDGDSDEHLLAEMKEINKIISEDAAHQDEIQARIKKLKAAMREAEKIYAVDSPDGEDDGHLAEEMEEIKHLIDDAAIAENGELKKKILYQHKMEKAVQAERARDPEHDW